MLVYHWLSYFNVFFPMNFVELQQDFRQSLEVAALKDEVGLFRYRGLNFDVFPTKTNTDTKNDGLDKCMDPFKHGYFG